MQVDKNRAKFVHIKDTELLSRKKFVEDAQQSITCKSSIPDYFVAHEYGLFSDQKWY